MTPLLRIDKLVAGYRGSVVVRGLDLEIRSGEVVALLGSNGAGKTTTLRAISGIVTPSSGTIVLDGHDLATVTATRRHRNGIAHVPEGRGIFYGLTVAEHFRLGSRSERLDPEAAYAHFPALRELQGRRAGLLSGGEQQMLAIGRALARKPRLLLLDELSLGLAPVIVERLLPVVRQFADDSDAAVLLVEQQVPMALKFADRAYVVSHGRIVLHETADHLRQNPDLMRATYLGEAAIAAVAS
jgi:ABC-type branched-subunit amino acid transport system ATPase component